VVIIVLAVATLASVTALFLRGFKLQDITEQLTNQELQTPTLQVWLLKTEGYDSKMSAYQSGISAASNGLGVYVLPENGKWTWVAGVYSSEDAANDALNQTGIPSEAKIYPYQITGKKFSISPDVLMPCQQVLNSVQNVFAILLNLRTAITVNDDIKSLQLDLITDYNQIKSGAENLQTLNANLQSKIIATIIYTANQNLLGLQDIVYADAAEIPSLAIINTALLKSIFSLDNF